MNLPNKIWVLFTGKGKPYSANDYETPAPEYIRRGHLMEFVNKQAEDEGLWCKPLYASEAFMQTALRDLHRLIEDGVMPEDKPDEQSREEG